MNDNQLLQHGIDTEKKVHWNLPAEELLNAATQNNEGKLTDSGALCCETGPHTGRSPGDRFIVKDIATADTVDWGAVNKPMKPEHFAALRDLQRDYLKDKELYVRDALAGADQGAQIPIRVINETAWANLFAHHLFLRPEGPADIPLFTIIHTPGCKADPEKHGTNSEAFVAISFSEKVICIGGTKYAGEMKKIDLLGAQFSLPRPGHPPDALLGKLLPGR